MVGAIRINLRRDDTSCTHVLFKELTSIAAFASTGDLLLSRGGTMDQYSQLINNGVRIAFMYGDRDYVCNCKLIRPHGVTLSSMLILIEHKRAGWTES